MPHSRRRVRSATLCLAATAVAACSSIATPDRPEILWDEWGVPHIYAANVEDLGYAFGWAQMHNHANAILRLYGSGRGRAAEYWGEDYIASDRFLRTTGIPEAGAEAYAAQTGEFRRYIDAFVAGMNAYAREHPDEIADPLERVLPVRGADPFRNGLRAVFAFLSRLGNRGSLTAGGMGAGMVAAAGAGSGSNIDAGPRNAAPAPITAGPPALGSNGWAIAPGRSASGNAMLLQNPHLPWRVPLMHWFEAQLVAPGMNISGVTLLGLPVIAIGFNEHLGWTHTNNTLDAFDTYRLTLADGGYVFDGEVRAFEVERDTLRVRREDGSLRSMPITIRSSVHGPVIRAEDGTAIAVRGTGMRSGAGSFRQWWEMGRATNLDEFQAALRRLAIPMFNVLYADEDGHILYLFNGRIPERSFGDFAYWRTTVPGDTSVTLWTDIHEFGELPMIVDPATGFLQNSNSPPWFATVPSPLDADDFPPYMAPEFINFREQSGIRLLRSDSSITFDELLTMRYSNRMLLADRLLDELLPAARESRDSVTRRAAEVLSDWDGEADAESRGAVLFSFWAQQIGFYVRIPGAFAVPWSEEAPVSTPDGLANPAGAVSTLGQVARTVEQRYGRLDITWGEVNRLVGGGRNLPGNGAPGGLGVFHVVSYAPAGEGQETFHAVHGDTWVAAVEFTPDGPRARALLSYGNATQPSYSEHAWDQLELLAEQRMRPIWRDRAEVEKHLEREIALTRADSPRL